MLQDGQAQERPHSLSELVAALSGIGTVGTIKHIADHLLDLPEEKDTTKHYQAGAVMVSGIDQEKTMITCKTRSLEHSLKLLSDAGIRYAIVEGFKRARFKKITINSPDIEALMRNPTVSDVVERLDEFDEYYTLSGLYQEIEKEPGPGIILSMSGMIQDLFHYDECMQIEKRLRGRRGVNSVRFRCNMPLSGDITRFFLLVKTESPVDGNQAISLCLDEMSQLHPDCFQSSRGICADNL